MAQVLDYSVARPDPASIAAAGYVGVMRYVAPLPADEAKVITAAEYENLLGHGLKVVLNWEWYDVRAREGAAAGTADAQEALRQANNLGYTGPIYFSVDWDAAESEQPQINAYFEACAQVIGLERLGAYAGYWPLKRLFDVGLIRYGWQTFAWSGGNREARAHLYQNGATAFSGGADVNDILQADWAGGAMSGVPQGWSDDTTNEILTAPNGVKVQWGFRDWILSHPWNPENYPLAPEYTTTSVEPLVNPTTGAGSRLDCRECSLGYTTARGVFTIWTGYELQTLKAQAAAPAPPPAPTPDPKADAAKTVLKAAQPVITAWLDE